MPMQRAKTEAAINNFFKKSSFNRLSKKTINKKTPNIICFYAEKANIRPETALFGRILFLNTLILKIIPIFQNTAKMPRFLC